MLVPGQIGLVVTRQRLLLEDGVEKVRQTERTVESQRPGRRHFGPRHQSGWCAQRQSTARRLNTWRKVSVYATSTNPVRRRGHGHSSGIPLTKGIIAVTLDWYRGMKLQPVYVPGYGRGIIADTGGGIPGRYWIDLGI